MPGDFSSMRKCTGTSTSTTEVLADAEEVDVDRNVLHRIQLIVLRQDLDLLSTTLIVAMWS